MITKEYLFPQVFVKTGSYFLAKDMMGWSAKHEVWCVEQSDWPCKKIGNSIFSQCSPLWRRYLPNILTDSYFLLIAILIATLIDAVRVLPGPTC